MDLIISVIPANSDHGSSRICSLTLEFDHALLVEGFLIWTGDDKKIHLVSPKYTADTFNSDGNYEKKNAVTFTDLRLRDRIIQEAIGIVEDAKENPETEFPKERSITFPAGGFHVAGSSVKYHNIRIGNAVEIHGIVATKDASGKEIKLPEERHKGKMKPVISFTNETLAKDVYKKIKV